MLCRYGFHKDRCKEALHVCDEDVGMALEYLHAECFNLNNANTPVPKEDMADIVEQRNDEMVALKSIYEDRFIERIPQKLWIVKLDLPHLDKLTQPVRSTKTKTPLIDSDNREVCRFFKKGFCKFGRRCRMKHSKPEGKAAVYDSVVEIDPNADSEHEVEIRFPTGNLYPKAAPFVAFTSTSRIEKHICLNITKHMMTEAKGLADVHEPSVFSVISMLDDDFFLDKVVTEAPSEFSSTSNRAWINDNSASSMGMRSYETMNMPSDMNDTVDNDAHLANAADRMIRMSDREADRKHEPSPEKVKVKKSSNRDQAYNKKVNPAETLKTNKKLIEDFTRKQVSTKVTLSKTLISMNVKDG